MRTKVQFLLTVHCDVNTEMEENPRYLAVLTEERLNNWLQKHLQEGRGTVYKSFQVEVIQTG